MRYRVNIINQGESITDPDLIEEHHNLSGVLARLLSGQFDRMQLLIQDRHANTSTCIDVQGTLKGTAIEVAEEFKADLAAGLHGDNDDDDEVE